jgi:hypothetical protein
MRRGAATLRRRVGIAAGRRLCRRVRLIVLRTDGDLFLDAIRRMAGVREA